MRLRILSDPHIDDERGRLPAARDHDGLIVAGDIIPRMERGVRWLAENGGDRDVVYIPGNHEGYGADIDRTVAKARAAAVGTRIRVLQDEAVEIGGVLLAGATLWTDFGLHGTQGVKRLPTWTPPCFGLKSRRLRKNSLISEVFIGVQQ